MLPHRFAAARRVVAPALLVAAACGDGTGPRATPTGFYRLRAIEGFPVPTSLPIGSVNPTAAADEGQLLLTGDGRFQLALVPAFGGYFEGRTVERAGGLALAVTGGDTIPLALAGDEAEARMLVVSGFTVGAGGALVRNSTRYAYQFARAPLPANPVADGRWVLRTVDGRTPGPDGHVVLDAPVGGGLRAVQLIAFDTLELRGPFVRRSERVVTANGLPLDRPGVLVGVQEAQGHGVVAAGAGRLVVRAVSGQWTGGATADTLAASGSALVRRLSFGAAGTRELRYERVP